MELKALSWAGASTSIYPEVKLHPLLISPNNPIGGINRIAQILKSIQADPTHKKTVKIVKRCWKIATELSTGKNVLRACMGCLALPETEESKKKTKYFSFKMEDGSTFSFPAYFKDALAADSSYFRALRKSDSGEIAIPGISGDSFERLIKCWLAKPLISKLERGMEEQTAFDILKEGIPFDLSPRLAEQSFCYVNSGLSYDKRYENMAKQILATPSEEVLENIFGYFVKGYLKTNNHAIKSTCKSYLQKLKGSVITHKIAVGLEHLSLVQKFSNTGWCISRLDQEEWDDEPIPEASLKLLRTSSSIYSVAAEFSKKFTNEVLVEIAKNPNIQKFTLMYCSNITDEGIKALVNSKIAHIDFLGCLNLSDASLFALASISTLTTLNVNRCPKLTHKGIKALAENTNLRSLHLEVFVDRSIDEAIIALAEKATLTHLELIDCEYVTDEAIIALAKKATLTHLELSHCQNVTDKGIMALAKKAKLTHLELIDCQNITDKGIISLAKNPYLTHLRTTMCDNLTDKSLFALAKDSNLTSLDVSYCNVTDEGILALIQGLNLEYLNIENDVSRSRSIDILKQHPHIVYEA